MVTGSPKRSGTQRATMSAGVRNGQNTGKPCVDHELGVARAAVDDEAEHAARLQRLRGGSSPISATSWLFGWQTIT